MSERAITILHLSDLQFGQHHRFERAGETGSLLDRLGDARSRIEAGGRPDLIVLTGDLAETGTRAELKEVRLFAEGLLELFALPRRRLVMVPGNHDINWRLSKNYFDERKEEGDEPKRPYWPKLQYYAELFAEFYRGEGDPRFDEEQPWTLHVYEDLKVVVAGLNSTIAESHRQEDHYGFLGEEQIRAFAGLLAPYKDRGWLRIGAVHHNVLHPESPAAEQDRDDFCRRLGPYLNVVLHGHIHHNRVGWADANVPVLGIGSTGVKAPQRVPEVGNQYQLVRIYRDRLRCEAERYEPSQKDWIAETRIDPRGRTGVLERAIAFARVEATFAAPVHETGADDAALAAAVARYREQVVLDRRTTLSEPMGFGDEHRAVDFLDLFVVPRARPTPPEALPVRALEDDEPRTRLMELERQREDRFRPPLGPVQDLDRLLASPTEPWLLVLGAPGAGKTALTRWLMLSLCEPGAGLAGLPEDLVPVRIEMRRFDDAYRRSKRPYDFFAFLADEQAELSTALGDEHLRELARAGRLLWIFDGLDEVTDPGQRRRYTEMIAGLRSAHPGSRGLVTSRILGLWGADEVLRAAGVPLYTLLPFDDGQVEKLLDRWHAAMFAGAPEVGRRRRERLRAALREAPSLRRLCVSPLLATMVAYLNRDEDLPRRRHQLYQKVIERMADAWDAAKGLPGAPGQRRFPLDHKLRFLRRLAWQMLEEDGAANVIHEDELIRFASRFCVETYDEEPDEARRSAEQLVQHLCERNHVLVPLGARLFGFVHRTFLEHLAAAEVYVRYRGPRPTLTLEEVGEVFRRRWQEERWQETLMLLCGLLDDRDQPEDVVAALQRIASRPGPEWQVDRDLDDYMVFVVRALAEVEQLEREPVRTFISRWMDLLEQRLFTTPAFRWDKLAAAFRLHEGRWPELERLLGMLRKQESPKAHLTDYERAHHEQLAIAAGGKDRRLSLLMQALAAPGHASFVLFSDAAELGGWSDAEVVAICDRVSSLDDDLQLHAVRALLRSPLRGSACDSMLLGMLEGLVRSSARSGARYSAAKLILGIQQQNEIARGYLLDLLRDENGSNWIRGLAAVDLSSLGMREEALPVILSCLPDHSECMRTLVSLANGDPSMCRYVDEVICGAYTLEEDQRFVQAVNGLAVSGVRGVDETSLLNRLLKVREVRLRVHAAGTLFRSAELAGVGLRALEAVYESDPEGNFDPLAAWLTTGIDRVDSSLDRFLLKLMSHGCSPSMRISIAGLVFNRSRTASAREQARELLLSFLSPGMPEDTRFQAARNIEGQEGFETIQDLARTAEKEHLRRRAAEAVSNRAVLLDLARSPQEDVRRYAMHDLRTLQLLRALLQVGHPRRARVRLDGQPVGILEERPSGGYLFTYDPAYVTPEAIPVSLTMPVRSAPYPSPTLHPFFENLLPEGWLLNQISATQGIASTDAFGLLLATGADCAGAVEVVPLEADQP